VNRRDRGVVMGLVLVLLALGVVAGLPPAPAAETIPVQPTPDATQPPAAVYREGVVGVPESITPVTARSRAERTLVGLIFAGLVRLGPGTTYQADLADSWTTSDDGRTWTFHIRDDAVWQDGEPVTADDVVYTVSALKSPDAAGAMAGAWADVTAEAVDDQTVVFTLDAPVAGFLAAATQPLLPEHLLADIPLADLASSEYAALPVGSGPFAISEIDAEHAVLVPSATVLPDAAVPDDGGPVDDGSAPPGSPGPSAGDASGTPSEAPETPAPLPTSAMPSPYLDQIEVRFYGDETGVAAALTSGAIDGAAGLSTPTSAELAALPGVERFPYPTTTLSAVLLNLRAAHPELRDPDVRRALLAAIDRDALVTDALGGDAVRADALVPPESWAYDAASADAVAHDPKAAAKLLTGAGWTKKGGKWYAPKAKSPFGVELLTVPAEANPRAAAVAAFVRDAWTDLGVKVTVKELTGSELGARLREGDYTAAVLDIAEGLEPDLYPLLASSQVVASGSNLAGYQDTALDKLLEAARKPGTLEQRQAAWKLLLAGLAKRLPLLPLAWSDEVMVARGVEGPAPRLISHPGDRFWDVLAWRLAASR
jgi:peptide/nickel transport system substrate-binding protein